MDNQPFGTCANSNILGHMVNLRFFLSVMNIQVERGIYDQIFMPKSFYGVYLFKLAIYEFILKLYKQELIFNSIKVVQVS